MRLLGSNYWASAENLGVGGGAGAVEGGSGAGRAVLLDGGGELPSRLRERGAEISLG